MKKQSVIKRIREWYYNGNDCAKCPAAQDTTWSSENGTEYDFCCLAGHCENDVCRLPLIIRLIRARRGRYLMNHEYDDYGEFMEEREKDQEAMHQAIMEHLFKRYGPDMVLAWRDGNGVLHEANTASIIRDGSWNIMRDFEDYQKSKVPLSKQVLDIAMNAIQRPFRYIWSFIGK